MTVTGISGCRSETLKSEKRESAKPDSETKASTFQTDWQPPADDGYVGSQACSACHAETFDSFMAHPMARSLRRVDPEAEAQRVTENGHLTGDRRTYGVEIDQGRLRHYEEMFDDDDKLIYKQSVPMDYVVGSGRRAYAYLSQRDSLLFMSPLNFYTEAQHWDLAPGYRKDDPRRFDRRVTEECLSCHAGRMATAGRRLNRFRDPPFHEQGIGCENCHGPGAEHMALHQASDGSETGAVDPIVNPARLDPDRRESVCNQCHLSAEVRVPRYGRSDFDFRPGMKLEDVWSVLLGGDVVSEDGTAKAVSNVQQMRASRCYTQSDGRLGCISCHDPHRVPAPAERVAFYRQRCLKCHDEESCAVSHERRLERDNSCIDCHMPRRGSSNIAHVTLTDHRVIRSAESAPTEQAGESDQLTFFDDAHQRLAAWEQDRALGIGAWQYLTRKGHRPEASLAQVLLKVLDQAPDDGVVLTILGAMAMDYGKPELARTYYERALLIPAAEETALLGLLKIDYLAGRRQSALGFADRLLAVNRGQAQVHAMRADLLKSLGRPEEAIEAAKLALEFNPTLIPVRQWLVTTYGELDKHTEQREQQDLLRRMQEAPPTP